MQTKYRLWSSVVKTYKLFVNLILSCLLYCNHSYYKSYWIVNKLVTNTNLIASVQWFQYFIAILIFKRKKQERAGRHTYQALLRLAARTPNVNLQCLRVQFVEWHCNRECFAEGWFAQIHNRFCTTHVINGRLHRKQCSFYIPKRKWRKNHCYFSSFLIFILTDWSQRDFEYCIYLYLIQIFHWLRLYNNK